MLEQLAQNWWLVVVRGILAIAFGVLAFAWPAITIFVLVMFFGAYALVDGIFAVIAAVTHAAGSRRWWMLLGGIAGIVLGILTFFWPGLTAFSLLYLIAAWAFVTGIFEILAAIELRKVLTNEWLLVISGVLSIAFGVLVAIYPGAGALGIIWLIASYAVIFGVLLVALGFRLRTIDTKITGRQIPRPA